MFKGFITSLTDVINFMNYILKKADEMGVELPVAFGALSGIFKTIKFNAIEGGFRGLIQKQQELQDQTQQSNNEVKGLWNTLKAGVGATSFGKVLSNAKTQFVDFKNQFKSSQGIINKFKTTINGVSTGIKSAGSGIKNFASNVIGTKLAVGLLNVGMTALNMAISTLIAWGVQKVFQGIKNEIKKTDNALEKHTENIQNYKSEIKDLNDTKSSLQEIQKEYDKLAEKTDKTSEEQKRFNELRQELADTLGEDYILAYDEEGNPILKMNGDVQDLINELDIAIQRKNTLLNSEKKSQMRDAITWLNETDFSPDNFGNKKSQKDDIQIGKISQNISKARSNVINEWLKLDNANSEQYNKTLSNLRDYLANYSDSIEEGYSKAFEKYQEVEEQVQKVRDGITSDLANDADFNNLSDTVKNFGYNLSSSLDFSEVSSADVTSYIKGIKDALSDDEIDPVLSKYQDLRDQLNKTGQFDEYEKSVESLVPQLADLWGVSEDVVKSMVAVPSVMKVATSELDAYLMTFGKREQMKGFDKETNNLIARYEAFKDTINDLSNMESYTDENGEVVFDVKAVASLKDIENMPDQINSLIDDILNDGKVTEEEHTLLLNLSMAYTEPDEEQREWYLNQAEESYKSLFPDGKLNLGDITVEADYEIAEDSKEKINEKFKELDKTFDGREDVVKTIKPVVKNTDQVQMFADIITYLNASPENTNKFIKAEIDNLDDMQSYEDVINFLLGHPEIVNKYNIKLVGEKSVDTIEKQLDNLLTSKDEKEISIKLKKSLEEGDLNSFNEELSELPDEKEVEVRAKIGEALDNIDTVDAKTIKEKIVNFKTSNYEKTKNQENTVSKGAKDEEKKTKFTQKGFSEVTGYMTTVEKKASNPSEKKVNIVVDIIEKVKGAWKLLNSGTGGIYSKADGSTTKKSVDDFSNISNNPMETEMSAQSETFSNISSTPTDTTSSDATSTPSIGQRVKAMALKPFGSIGASSTRSTSINITKSSVNKALEYSIELLQELQNRIDKVNNKLDLLGSKMEKAVGTEKISYLEKQNELYKEQQKLQQELYDNLTKEKTILKSQLKGYGFKFDAQGNLTEYEEILTKLEEKSKKASDASSNYSGKSDKKRKSLEKSADKASEKLDKVKKLTDEYLQLQYTELPNAEKEWQDLANSIKENEDEIEKLVREDKLYKFVNKITEINNQLEISSNKLDIIDAKLNNAYGSDEITLTKQKLELLNEQLLKQQEIMEAINSQLPIYQEDLAKYGAIFDKDGNISNIDEILNSFQNSQDREKVSDLIDEYIEKINNDLPEAEKSYEDLRNTIIKTQQDSLEKTKDIEEKIADMIQDQLDKRKKALEEQADKEIELINKQKEAYNNARDEEDYQKELSEQQKKISDIKKNIELAKKDNSLSGRAKLQELLEQLDEENKSLQDMVQNRNDELMNKMFEEQTDKIQSNSDDAIKKLEETFTDQKIAQMIQDSLLSGVFTDIDGNVMNLQDALVNFAETSGEALGIMGDTIKNELVENLASACNYAKDYKNIMDNLQLKSYGNLDYANGIQTINDNKNVVLGDTYITVNGNADDTTVKKIRIELDNYMKEIINKI